MRGAFSTRILHEFAKGRAVILDAGCGNGTEALSLARRNLEAEVIGYDRDWRALEIARERRSKHKVENVSFYEANHDDFELDPRFGMVYSTRSLVGQHELPKIEAGADPLTASQNIVTARLQKFRRLLAPNGVLVLNWLATENRNNQLSEIAESSGFRHLGTRLGDSTYFESVRGIPDLRYQSSLIFERR